MLLSLGFATLISLSSRAETIRPEAFDFQAIQKAMQRVAAGDTIQLAAGNYELTEPIQLKSGIRLIGSGKEKTWLSNLGAGCLRGPIVHWRHAFCV